VWFSGKIPLDSRFYPQLIPINWSLTYAFIGGATVQLFAKSIMPMFIIGILLQLFDLGITFQQPGYFLAMILSRALFLKFIKTGIDNGLVDIAVAFFALLPFYTLLKAQAAKTETEQRILWILGFFLCGSRNRDKAAGCLRLPDLSCTRLYTPATPSLWQLVKSTHAAKGIDLGSGCNAHPFIMVWI